MIAKTIASLVLLAELCRAGDVQQLQQIIRSTIDSKDDSQIPKVKDSKMEENIATLTPAEVRSVLPLLRQCWSSPRIEVRRAGLGVTLGVALRPDSTPLLEPLFGDIAGLLGDSEEGIRKGTIYILGSTQPFPSPRALGYLVAHLQNPRISHMEITMISGGIVQNLQIMPPAIPVEVRNVLSGALGDVLDTVSARRELGAAAQVLFQLGQFRIMNEKVIGFFKTSLGDVDSIVRQAAVEAAGKMDVTARGTFARELQRIATNPDESAEIRALAQKVLQQQ